MSKYIACLFGINYYASPQCRLNGCINDVVFMGNYLKKNGFSEVQVLTDARGPADTSRLAILSKLADLAARTRADPSIKCVWVHYSGHGTYQPDINRDEDDGVDECLVPSDFQTAGVIRDDILRDVLSSFSPSTRVVFITDACHSATMGDLRYLWQISSPTNASKTLKNALRCNSDVVMISGCKDNQTSADAYNYTTRMYQGALTATLLDALNSDPTLKLDAVKLVWIVNALLRRRGFTQVSQLSSSSDLLTSSKAVIPPVAVAATLRGQPAGGTQMRVVAAASKSMCIASWKRVVAKSALMAGSICPITKLC
jgi:metacaspase-1